MSIFPEVSRKQAVELDLDRQSLESLVKKNVHPDARVYFEGDKIYVMGIQSEELKELSYHGLLAIVVADLQNSIRRIERSRRP